MPVAGRLQPRGTIDEKNYIIDLMLLSEFCEKIGQSAMFLVEYSRV